jgi:hypothetical protein
MKPIRSDGCNPGLYLLDYGGTMNDTKPTVSQVGSADSNNKDRFISLQLIPLLLLPGTPVIISSVLSICGLSSDEVDAVRAIYI